MKLKYDAFSRGAIGLKSTILASAATCVAFTVNKLDFIVGELKAVAITFVSALLLFFIESLFVVIVDRINDWEIDRKIAENEKNIRKLQACYPTANVKLKKQIQSKIETLQKESVNLISRV